jgi:hypothetical protein
MVKHTGTIVDEAGQPLWGAHVITLNSTPRKFTTTNVNGVFNIEGDIGESFEITFIGFRTQNFTLRLNMLNKRYMLIESAEQLDEVVLTPRTKVPLKKNNPWDFNGFLENIGNIFTDASTKIAPINNGPNNGFTTTLPTRIAPPNQDKKGLSKWVGENPALAGGIVLALIAGTGYALSKKESASKYKDEKKKQPLKN